MMLKNTLFTGGSGMLPRAFLNLFFSGIPLPPVETKTILPGYRLCSIIFLSSSAHIGPAFLDGKRKNSLLLKAAS
ncbi:hypothetical protein [Paenibacillus apiarius]|uniref:hypothetical protein n=1 Tax=Paenibacillus apiarius TaxID=46240 RepID=UPI003B3B167F